MTIFELCNSEAHTAFDRERLLFPCKQESVPSFVTSSDMPHSFNDYYIFHIISLSHKTFDRR